MEFTDENSAEDFRLEFEGVHFIGNGSIYGFAEPPGLVRYVKFIFSQLYTLPPDRRHIDIRLLPSLVPEHYRNETVLIIAPELSARIAKLRTLIDQGVVDQEMSNLSLFHIPLCNDHDADYIRL
jgi:transmembrane E3 ubiquitin-protein ligase